MCSSTVRNRVLTRFRCSQGPSPTWLPSTAPPRLAEESLALPDGDGLYGQAVLVDEVLRGQGPCQAPAAPDDHVRSVLGLDRCDLSREIAARHPRLGPR